MNLSGNNTLSISEQTGISFLVDLSLNNIDGKCNLGFKEGPLTKIYPHSVNNTFYYDNFYIYEGGSVNTINTVFNSGEFQANNSEPYADVLLINNGFGFASYYVYDDGFNGQVSPIEWTTDGEIGSQNNAIIYPGAIVAIKSLTNKNYTISNQAIIKKRHDLNFQFTNGKIFDPTNKLIYTYNANENIKLSGNINSSGYDYYINDYYLSNTSSKNYAKFDTFYLNTSGCIASTELYINGDRPSYKLDFNNFYYVKENITGFVSGDPNLKFKIYSGEIIYPLNSNFNINVIPSNQDISNQKYTIVVTPDLDTTKQLYLDKTGNFIFGLYTNFGKISGVFELNSQYFTTGYIYDFNINKNSETFFTQPGQVNTDFYVLGVDFVFGNETGSYSIDKNLSFLFEYASGYTGLFTEEININTGINTTLTGFISGSGYLSKTFFVTGSGINLLNNSIVTGEIYSDVNQFVYLNGFVVNEINVQASGGTFFSQTVSGYDSGINFGRALGLNAKGDLAIIGAPNSLSNSGLVYIFNSSNNNWNQIAELSGEFSGDRFGYSVASNASGNKFLIGAPYADSGSGAAYIYNLNNGNWDYQRITGSELNIVLNTPLFGNSVAFNKNGDVGVIGSIREREFDGAIYIFTGNNIDYDLKQKISGDQDMKTQFGYSIAVNDSGNVIVASQPYENYGSAYIITGNNNNWGKCKKIYQENLTSGFGFSIDINSNGNSIIVGAPWSNHYSGLAFLFTGNGNDWNISKTFSGDGRTYKFGNSVGINSNGNKIIIGGANLINTDLIGKTWVYTSNNNWEKVNEFTGNYSFGFTNSLNSTGNIYLIGDLVNSKTTLVSDNFYFSNITGQISGFAENGILYYEDNFITNIDGTTYTGEYIDSIIATGIASGNYSLILNGLTDITYEKTFTGTFNIITGYSYTDSSGNLIPTGNINFQSGNYITNGKYTSGSYLPSNINKVNIFIEKRNFYDNYAMSGNLYITGKNLINNLVTGIKIPVISTGINAIVPENIIILIP